MNLPEPGTPEFEKLIRSQPKPDYTKAPEIKVPCKKAHGSLKPGKIVSFDSTKPLLLGKVPESVGLPPLLPALADLQTLHAIQGQLYASLQKGLDAALYGQLDCTEIEAQRTARCVDWDARDRMLDTLNRKCSS